jgi:hypothetical protein
VYFSDQEWKDSVPYQFWYRMGGHNKKNNVPPQRILTPLAERHGIDKTDLSPANLERTKALLDRITDRFWVATCVFCGLDEEGSRPTSADLARLAWDHNINLEDLSAQNLDRMRDILLYGD